MPQRPLSLIIRTAGSNCDRELAHAFERAGARARLVHLNALAEDPGQMAEADLIGLPGGFSYGDDIAAGRILANRLRHALRQALCDAIDRGTPIIGICNGCQALIKMGLLPDPTANRQQATLADNATERFIDRWVGLAAAADSPCIWTRGLDQFELPIAHGEGRFVPESDQAMTRWREQGQIALRYAPDNPNGSADAVAGVCDPTGLALALMPHPERFTHPTHHPNWTRQAAEVNPESSTTPAGLRLFQNAVNHVQSRR